MTELESLSLSAIILKVAAPCNLNCTYCYEYNSGDESWREKPKIIPKKVLEAVITRIDDHYHRFPGKKLSIILHGGEPLLAGYVRLRAILEEIRNRFHSDTVSILLQTNGTLLNERIVDLLARHNVTVGISIDGGEGHNAKRPDLLGRSSWARATRGIDLLRDRAPQIYGGVLAVVDVDTNPVAVLEALATFKPPSIDLLQPFYNHDDPDSAVIGAKWGVWLTSALQHWLLSESMRGIKIRCLSEAFLLAAGKSTTSDWFGAPRPNYIVIETDGTYNLLDSLKTIGAGSAQVRSLSASVEAVGLQEALELSDKLLSSQGAFEQPIVCHSCKWRSQCKGGYLATRYSAARKFDNPSVYCEGIKQVFDFCSDLVPVKVASL